MVRSITDRPLPPETHSAQGMTRFGRAAAPLARFAPALFATGCSGSVAIWVIGIAGVSLLGLLARYGRTRSVPAAPLTYRELVANAAAQAAPLTVGHTVPCVGIPRQLMETKGFYPTPPFRAGSLCLPYGDYLVGAPVVLYLRLSSESRQLIGTLLGSDDGWRSCFVRTSRANLIRVPLDDTVESIYWSSRSTKTEDFCLRYAASSPVAPNATEDFSAATDRRAFLISLNDYHTQVVVGTVRVHPKSQYPLEITVDDGRVVRVQPWRVLRYTREPIPG